MMSAELPGLHDKIKTIPQTSLTVNNFKSDPILKLKIMTAIDKYCHIYKRTSVWLNVKVTFN